MSVLFVIGSELQILIIKLQRIAVSYYFIKDCHKSFESRLVISRVLLIKKEILVYKLTGDPSHCVSLICFE